MTLRIRTALLFRSCEGPNRVTWRRADMGARRALHSIGGPEGDEG
jgi:hypothetical protein